MRKINFFNRMRGESGKFANTPPYGFNRASRMILSLLSVMFVCVGNAWGATNENFSFSSPSAAGSGTTLTYTWEGTCCTIKQEKGNSTTNVSTDYSTAPRWYQNHIITFTPKSGYTITKVVISTSGNKNGQTMTFTQGEGSISSSGNTTTITGSWTSAFKLKMGSQCQNPTVTLTYSSSTPVVNRTVSWVCNGSAWTSGVVTGNTTVASGSKISAVPTAPTSSNCDNTKAFVGWTATENYSNTNTAPSDLFTDVSGSPAISSNITFYAVFASESIEGGDVIANKTSGFSASTTAQTLETGKTITYKSSNANTYGHPLRVYTNNSFTIANTGTGKISKIEITLASGYDYDDLSSNVGSYSSGTWTGSASSVTFTASAQVRVSSVKVTYSDIVITNSNYATSCCTPHNVTIGTHDNGEISVDPTSACEGTTINVTLTPNTGYRLASWSVNNEEQNGTLFSMPDADAVVSATFVPEVYTISYKDEGNADYSGSNLASLPTYHTYNTATQLVDGVRDGFSFAGWFTDATCETPAGSSIAANSKTADFTLYAKWTAENKKRVTISEVSNGTVSVTYEGMESPLTNGYRDLSDNTVLTISATPANGYELSSLKIGDNSIENNSQHTLTAAITISATFSPINYTITYHLDEGINNDNNPANYTIASGEITLEDPTKTGYSFDGWFDNENKEGDAVTAIAANSTGNKEFWAKWNINSYSISWITDGDELTGDYTTGSVDFGTDIVAPNTPTKTGYTFAGWDASIAATMPASDVTYTATWTVNKYHVYFQNNGEIINEFTKEVEYHTAIGDLPSYDDSCDPTSTSFRGWTTSVITIKQENAPTFAASTNLMPAEDLYLNAVYASETEGPEANVPVFSQSGTGNPTSGYSLTLGGGAELPNGKSYYQDGGSGATKRWIQIKKNNTSSAMINTTPKSVTVTATLGGGQAKDPLGNGVYAVWINASGEEIGDPVLLTDKITNANGSGFEANLPVANATSAYGVRVYHTKESGYNVRYYGISLSYKVSSVDYSDFVTSCCSLKPVTNVSVNGTSKNSVSLTWSAPTDKTGISKLQIINAANNEVVTDDIDKDALTGTVNGLSECETYNFIVVSVGTNCNAYSEAVEARPFGSQKTVTFVYNDGTTQDVVEHTSCDAPSVTVPTDPEREGYRFMGWFNGENQLTEATFTPTETSTTINAHWAELFTLHYNYDGASGAPADEQYIAGEEVTLPANPVKNVMSPFQEWSFSTPVEVAAGKFLMPASNLTITAVFGGLQGQWFLVTDANSLQAGDKVVIAAADYDYAMSTTQNNNNRGRAAVEKNGTTISAPSDNVQIFELEEGTVDGSWAFKTLNGTADKYIYAAGSSNNNYLKSEDTKSESGNSSFVLDIENEKATAQGTSTNKVLRYNTQGMFSCYGSASQSGIAFYQFREGTFYNVNMPGSVTGGTITTNASMAKVGETVTLTYTPKRGYTIGTLTVTGVEITPALTEGITEYTFTMPDEDVTVTASFDALPAVVYNLLENTSDLAMGQKFVIVGTKTDGTDPYVAGEIDNNGRLVGDQVLEGAINTENKTLSLTAENSVDYIFDGEQSALKIKNNENKYLQAGNASVSWTTTGGNWTISFADSKTNLASGSYKLQRNGGNYEWFTTYESDQKPIHIYTLPYEQAYTLTYKNGDETIKTVKIVAGYEYTIVNTQTGTAPEGCTFYAWTDGTNYYQAGDQIIVNADITLTAAWIETLRDGLFDGKWGTYCPAQNVVAYEGATFYTIAYVEKQGEVPYKVFYDEIGEGESLQAGHPYIFIADEDATAIKGVKVGDPATVGINDHGFIGKVEQYDFHVTAENVANHRYYIVKDNNIRLCGEGWFRVGAERAYLDMDAGINTVAHAPAAGRRRVCLTNNAVDSATGVESIQPSEVSIQKVLINGELFILRGEKMYDAKGQLVK